ncbi:ankyrin repeat domain-containing protein 16-like isoform X2 [Varroa jacobsoni]|uniref:Ankyrin repeat domain-containing protein 16 n=1 Tax=Varroa destructor TaxID=109461 RepID=A0A7M7KQZ5_VARDE|nr:ankyrin repeat domain-containing protein 16-like isoform X1 [Varroa destructor]XP_022670410.1 ankyrin repeat domain-containing protein 16-like isoform X1 [Varroa destructor]XP_022670411.1 ankyrin repeat domain-containing protein 16-like isoform X1 [Varroa destructor]XP_022691348.1 ankyrin repeat domain-containing protein 16-like isoform X2 [Varroa jacobsoni]
MGKKESGAVKEQRKILFQAAQNGSLDCLPRGLLIRNITKWSAYTPEQAQATWDSRTLVQPASLDSVLHVAARNGNVNVIRFFLEYLKLDYLLTSTNQDGKCALHEAVQALQCEVSQYLIDRGTPVDVLKRADWTPLMLACTRSNNVSMVKLLLQNGARTDLRNKDGWTPFHICTRKGNLESLKILLAHDPFLLNTKSYNGRTPLHTAAIHGHSEIVRFIVSACRLNGQLVNAQDSCGSTPLMDAARFNSVECCDILIGHGAAIDKRDGVGRNAFHIAAQAGSTEVIRYFLGVMGASVKKTNSIESRLDNYKASTKNTRNGNDVHVNTVHWRTDNGQTVLHLAAREGHVDTVKYLLSIGANIEVKDCENYTAMDIARRYKNDQILETLNEHRDKTLK